MRVQSNSPIQNSNFSSSRISRCTPQFLKSTITTYRNFHLKKQLLSAIVSGINFIKIMLGIKTLSPYPAEWAYEKKIAMTKGPKETQLISFWKLVWNSHTNTIVKFSDPLPKDTDIDSIYWPVYPSVPLSFKSDKMRIILRDERTEYGHQDQLLIRREFLLEYGKKNRVVVQLVAFPNATKTVVEKAILAARQAEKFNSTILALYSGDAKTTKAFIEGYKA